ncbi:glycoside hydrolase family 6 protein [Streptomyces sp. NPDC088789]|uniref:glycoside hydrolase family 6 protein n=1 Tax=Streptomyces sp. NPDC088789 TaxID=3365899 RepID=UPI0037F7827E
MAGTYGDLVDNGTFSNGTTGWWSGTPTMVSLAAPDNGLEASATTDAISLWDAPFGQDDITLRQGVLYTVSFTARASQAGTDLRLQIGLGAAPWTAALDKTVTLTTADTHFVFQFTSTLSTTAGQISFQMGQGTEVTVYLTEVCLTCSTVREGFYTDPDSNAMKWIDQNPQDPRAPLILKALARRPGARWFGDWTTDVRAEVDAYVTAAAAVGTLPIVVAYNMYNRDNGGESSGGARTPDAYRSWIDAFASGIGDRPALVIIEPDSLAQAEYLPTETARSERYSLVAHAARTLTTGPRVRAYLDGANAAWLKPSEMVGRLIKGGITATRGFAVGVANFDATDISCSYGQQVVTELANRGVAGARFVIDTSRNGHGAVDDNGQHVDYCNPAGRRLGVPSSVGVGGAEYLLWIKVPGDSDGQCGVAPPGTPAGVFSPYLAERLILGR